MSLPVRFELPSSLEYFAALVAEEPGLALLEAAVAVGQVAEPGLDPLPVLAEIDMLGLRLRRRLAADAAPLQRLTLLNRFFFAELGFAVNLNHFHDPQNSYLHRVLATRRGIPVSLALLYAELAGQIGLAAQGVSFPGHFLVRLNLPAGPVIIDPATGQSLSRAALEERLEPLRRQRGQTGDVDVPLGLFLQPATPREILARLLGNLKSIHGQAQDWPALLEVQQRLVHLLPQAWDERRDRGLTLARLGRTDLAAQDLDQYLHHRPDAPDAASLRAHLADWRDLPRQPWH